MSKLRRDNDVRTFSDSFCTLFHLKVININIGEHQPDLAPTGLR